MPKPNTTPPMTSLQLKEIFDAKIDKLKNKPKLKSILRLQEGTSMFTLRSKSPMTPSTSPAHPTNPTDSQNKKDASIATVKD